MILTREQSRELAAAYADRRPTTLRARDQRRGIKVVVEVLPASKAWAVPMVTRLWVDDGHATSSQVFETPDKLLAALEGVGL